VVGSARLDWLDVEHRPSAGRAAQPIYLDHAATTPLDPEVRAALLPWLGELFGNPSSAHGHGRRARAAVDDARDRVAAAAGCASREVILTSGGTEADNLALRGVLERWGAERGRHLVVSAIEHEAVLATAQRLAEAGRADLTVVDCDRQGRIDPAAVASAVRPDTVLVSVMLANNEVGTVQDVPAIAAAVRARNPRSLVHTDAVQALGRLPLGLGALGVDLLSLSAHKAYGPQGVGALVAGHAVFPAAQITGGGQERERRSGTENVAGVVGFGAAAELARRRQETDAAELSHLAGWLTDLLMESVPGRWRSLSSWACSRCRLRSSSLAIAPAAWSARTCAWSRSTSVEGRSGLAPGSGGRSGEEGAGSPWRWRLPPRWPTADRAAGDRSPSGPLPTWR
jgi:cysteine desulfurase